MKNGKKFLALFAMLAITAGTVAPLMFAAGSGYADVPESHWASEVIAKWSGDSYGILSGYGDGMFEPSREINLGEMATILSRIFGYSQRYTVAVTPDWADEAVEKCLAAGVIPPAANIDASVALTREQAVEMIAKAYGIEPASGNTSFADDSEIGIECKAYVNAFSKLGYVVGKGGNLFDPKGRYTRAEAMQVLDNTTSEIADSSIAGQNFSKNLIVRKSGVTIKDTTVQGHLIIAPGAKDGEVLLENVTVSGVLFAAGPNVQLYASAGSVIPNIEVDAVHVTISGSGAVGNVVVNGGTGGIEVLTAPTTVNVSSSAGDVKTKNNGMIPAGKTLTTSADTTVLAPTATPAPSDKPTGDTPNSRFLSSRNGPGGAITRQEWTSRLVERANLTMATNRFESSYSDVDESSKYSWAIETARRNNATSVSDEDGRKFYPDYAATENFAVVTAVRALGILYKDLADLHSIANSTDMFVGTPSNKELTEEQAALILSAVDLISAAVAIDPNGEPEINYSKDVVMIEGDGISYSVTDYDPALASGATFGVYLKGIKELPLEAGSVAILPEYGTFLGGLALKVVAIETVSGGFMIYSITPPLEELLGEGGLKMEGSYTVKFAD
jgi:hypothetical protein